MIDELEKKIQAQRDKIQERKDSGDYVYDGFSRRQLTIALVVVVIILAILF